MKSQKGRPAVALFENHQILPMVCKDGNEPQPADHELSAATRREGCPCNSKRERYRAAQGSNDYFCTDRELSAGTARKKGIDHPKVTDTEQK